MLNEVLKLTNGAPFAQGHENIIGIEPNSEMNSFLKECHPQRDEMSEKLKNLHESVTFKMCQKLEPKTSCFGCKYDNCEVDEEERKKHCLSCLEPVTIRKNYTF